MTLTDFIKGQKTLLIAPAGHGKTHAIAECIKLSPDGTKQLVLTHTHAGISSIKSKLKKINVDESKYKVVTITGFVQGLVGSFIGLKKLGVTQEDKRYFDLIFMRGSDLFKKESVTSVIKLSYDGLFVDEYQDCSKLQHNLVMQLSKLMPTHLLGDPLQSIYDFDGGSIDFNKDLNEFDRYEILDKPWRWLTDGNSPELGAKILEVRKELLSDVQEIELADDEKSHYRVVTLNSVDVGAYFNQVGKFLRGIEDKSVLVIVPSYFDSKAGLLKGRIDDRALLCRQFNIDHDYILLEAIDDKSFYSVAKQVDSLISIFAKHRKNTKYIKHINVLLESLKFNKTDIKEWLDVSKEKVKARRAPHKVNVDTLESLVKDLIESPSLTNLSPLISFFDETIKLRSKRQSLLYTVKKCIRDSINNDLPVYENMCNHKNALRVKGRKVEGRCVGTTLLTKGLEFSIVVILDTHHLEDRNNFYVAVSRACKELYILTASEKLVFQK